MLGIEDEGRLGHIRKDLFRTRGFVLFLRRCEAFRGLSAGVCIQVSLYKESFSSIRQDEFGEGWPVLGSVLVTMHK